MLQEVVLGQPGEALLVDHQLGDGRRRRALAEQRPEGFALVEIERGDVHQADDVRCVRSDRGDDLTAVGVSGDQRRLRLQGQDVAQLGDIVGQRGVRELRSDHVMARRLQTTDHPSPGRTICPCTMYQYHSHDLSSFTIGLRWPTDSFTIVDRLPTSGLPQPPIVRADCDGVSRPAA